MKLKSIPRTGRFPSLRGGVMIYAQRGVLRVTKWPKKRGRPRSELQRWWNDWFIQANYLAKYADPMSQVRAIEMTKGTGLYPRDVLLSAMRGRLYWWADETGWKWYPMAALQDVSDALDILAQTVGSVLVRAADRWRPPTPGAIGDVLTYQGEASPAWLPAAGGGGGGFAGALVSKLSNQTPPNSVWTAVIYDAEAYDTSLIHDNVVNPTRLTVPADWTRVRLSGGLSWQWLTSVWRGQTFYKNGAPAPYMPRSLKTATGSSEDAISSPVLDVVPGDYFEHMAWHNRSSGVYVTGPNNHTWFAMERAS